MLEDHQMQNFTQEQDKLMSLMLQDALSEEV